MIVWALFDSGNGCYAQGVRELNEGGQKMTIYSVGFVSLRRQQAL